MVIDNSSTPGFTVYKPSDMKGIVAKQGRLPIFVFGNGACSHDSSYYIPMFASMVKSGYIVIAVGDNENKPDSGNHDMSTIGKDDNLLDADISWTRDSGDIAEDNAWAVTRANAGKNLPITVNDLGPNYMQQTGCKFKATAVLRDGVSSEAIVTIKN